MGSSARTITLASGCFWRTEAVFERLEGVISVECGYTNGFLAAPRYEQVCSGHTGHVEVVKLSYDPGRISLRQILEVFAAIDASAGADRMQVDVGPQYRSGIYVDNDADAALAAAVLADIERCGGRPVEAEICRRENYWPAEDYHRHFCGRHPHAGYCSLIVAPTVRRVQQDFARLTGNR
ncbi:peptide-methionine (S)-S-oxide reductase MsrA [Piscinibacter sakaiensis]|uniref:peptide-methionine (S)-S-oxide reductase MsrA n=1 Tax=Piscinibacter sakaiensis TaxID=1547922 RepID=UPI003AABA6AC